MAQGDSQTDAVPSAGLLGMGPLGIALGVLQAAQQANAANAQQQTNAATARWTPWTSLRPGANDWGQGAAPIAQGALAGQQAQSQQNVNQSYMNFLNGRGALSAYTAQPNPAMQAEGNVGPTVAAQNSVAHAPSVLNAMSPSGSGSGAGAYMPAGPYSGIANPVNAQLGMGGPSGALQSMTPFQASGITPPSPYSSKGPQYPFTNNIPKGYTGPTLNADGSLGPIVRADGSLNTGTQSYDQYDAPRAGS